MITPDCDLIQIILAMTGEISLVGQVLPVGGLKEKILAAHRAGVTTILAPAANRADIEENVPESVKVGIRFVYVEDVREVLHEAFKGEKWLENIVLPETFQQVALPKGPQLEFVSELVPPELPTSTVP